MRLAEPHGLRLAVALLLDDPQRAENARLPTSELPLADVSRLAGVLSLLPEEVRRSRGELGRVRAFEASL